ncbi:hypothetical protein OJ996_23230 [Luteolibacter sp. GHJ8]|uniref:Uncharacterized protein n=1 Tax=Luteolibacter rhizosphaerae TaxID=2989719 RepID=A0ABT3G9K1_9BACT|nr:hypothetical protein [Luteolibacter rhizosphaerae]MCW1916519.1 hypothetical protein [Luteolibacter rhizosphaerae]
MRRREVVGSTPQRIQLGRFVEYQVNSSNGRTHKVVWWRAKCQTCKTIRRIGQRMSPHRSNDLCRSQYLLFIRGNR